MRTVVRRAVVLERGAGQHGLQFRVRPLLRFCAVAEEESRPRDRPLDTRRIRQAQVIGVVGHDLTSLPFLRFRFGFLSRRLRSRLAFAFRQDLVLRVVQAEVTGWNKVLQPGHEVLHPRHAQPSAAVIVPRLFGRITRRPNTSSPRMASLKLPSRRSVSVLLTCSANVMARFVPYKYLRSSSSLASSTVATLLLV